MIPPPRTYWKAKGKISSINGRPGKLGLFIAMWKFRMKEDREPATITDADLISSHTPTGKVMPILDLDYDHLYLPSQSPGHGHLYLNVPISRFRWVLLMIGLRAGGVIQDGYFWWSLRRGGNFARVKPRPVRRVEPNVYQLRKFSGETTINGSPESD